MTGNEAEMWGVAQAVPISRVTEGAVFRERRNGKNQFLRPANGCINARSPTDCLATRS